jgi:RES domain-containing protein
MYHPVHASTLLYRWTSTPNTVWPDPVKGLGAYYAASPDAGRYHGPGTPTVYCSEDPLAAITEGAYYQALKWQRQLALGTPLHYPLVSRHGLWVVQIDPPPVFLDLR